jgi:hypothetical protein
VLQNFILKSVRRYFLILANQVFNNAHLGDLEGLANLEVSDIAALKQLVGRFHTDAA